VQTLTAHAWPEAPRHAFDSHWNKQKVPVRQTYIHANAVSGFRSLQRAPWLPAIDMKSDEFIFALPAVGPRDRRQISRMKAQSERL
jgi:hypothetical protein